jgi:phospholipid-translocating P-type ATPase (flippase)
MTSPYAQQTSVTVFPLRDDLNADFAYPDNVIKTSKYTILTFIPRNLYEQFRKVSNFYFLLTAAISAIPGAATVSPAANTIPLLFVVGVSMIKDGYEDFRRHQADNKANSIIATVLRQGNTDFVEVKSQEIQVGDIMRIHHNEEIRADCVILNTSHPEGTAYIDTANLDGESSLKVKRSPYSTRDRFGSLVSIIRATQPHLLEKVIQQEMTKESERRQKENEAEETDSATISRSEPLTPQLDLTLPPSPAKANSFDSHAFSHRAPNEPPPDSEPVMMLGSAPHPNLDAWKGQLRLNGDRFPLGLEHFLCRGAVLRNTDWALAVVMYTGIDTKMFLNLAQKPTKMSILDVKLNKVIGIVFLINQTLILIFSGLAVNWIEGRRHSGVWYLQSYIDGFSNLGLFWWNYLAYFVLISYMIPVSLFVTMELNKAVQAALMMFDESMMLWDGKEWKTCRPKTANMNEQLAHSRFIFTDKTGTLTENIMKYVGGLVGEVEHNELLHPGKLGIIAKQNRARNKSESPLQSQTLYQQIKAGGGKLSHTESSTEFGHPDTPSEAIHTRGPSMMSHGPSQAELVEDEHPDYLNDLQSLYLMALAVCHGVICFREASDIVYDGQSPDEIAFVSAARVNGFALVQRNSQLMEVEVQGEQFTRTFEILAELEFDANRKMMSVLVKDAETDVNILFSKGADTAMFAHASKSPRNIAYASKLEANLSQMASIGYRTLLVGCRILSEDEVEDFLAAFNKATVSMADRDAELRVCYKMIEKEYELIGTTAVEDKLQEGVPETIEFFLESKLVVWMLTGDKRETAVTIAATSKLLDPQVHRVIHLDVSHMNHDSEEGMALVFEQVEQQIAEATQIALQHPTVVVIDGKTLHTALQMQDGQPFLELGSSCFSGVCCRLTPLQKAEIVKLFQNSSDTTAVAVGDGANDVSMIQEGKVGIGIMGREGSQAELASDFAVPKFRHLKTLMMVHGRDANYRNSGTIAYSLFKNMALSFCLTLYGIHSAYAALPVFDSWLLAMYNTIFSQLPPNFFGMFDRDVAPAVSLKYPYIFPPLACENQYFGLVDFLRWGFDAVLYGVGIYWFMWELMDSDDLSYRSGAIEQHGTIFFSVLIFVILLRMVSQIRTWTVLQIFSIAASFAIFIAFLFVYSSGVLPDGDMFKDMGTDMMTHGKFYLYMVLLAFGGTVLVFVLRSYINETEFPSLAVIAVNTELEAREASGTMETKNATTDTNLNSVTGGPLNSHSTPPPAALIPGEDLHPVSPAR